MSRLLIVCVIGVIYIKCIDNLAVKRSVCNDDEVFVECAHCGPQRCDELGSPKPCAGSTGLCRPECVCSDGHVRDSKGKCILKNECPDCGGDRNATSGCGDHCGRSCSDYNDVNKTCFSSCQYNRCDCKEGFVFSDKLAVCILPDDYRSYSGYNDVNKTCLSSCQYNRCDCKERFVFSEKVSVCVPPSDC